MIHTVSVSFEPSCAVILTWNALISSCFLSFFFCCCISQDTLANDDVSSDQESNVDHMSPRFDLAPEIIKPFFFFFFSHNTLAYHAASPFQVW